MVRLVNKVFITLLSFSRSLTTKCVSLNNEPSLARPTLVDLNLSKFYYYLFMVSLDRFNRSCNALNDLSSKISVSDKTEDVDLNVFNMIAKVNESKALTKII